MIATPTRWQDVRISRAALKALADVPGLSCGPLSPLARIAALPGPGDRAQLIDRFEGIAATHETLAAALVHPRRLVSFLVGDGETQVVGQYVWGDAAGVAPGYKISAEGADVRCVGPLTSSDVADGFLELLAPATVPEVEPLRLSVPVHQFWALAALADTFQMANHLRKAARVSGPAVAFRPADVVAAWQGGIERASAGWAVSVFASLAPDAIPGNFVKRLPHALGELVEAGQLVRLDADPGDKLGDLYLLSEEFERLFRGLATGVVHFGLALQVETEPRHVESTLIGGWRSPGGLLVADLGGLRTGTVELLLSGPTHLVEFVEDLLTVPDAPVFDVAEPPRPTAAELIQQLRGTAGRRSALLDEHVCARCGAHVGPAAHFCGSCGAAQTH